MRRTAVLASALLLAAAVSGCQGTLSGLMPTPKPVPSGEPDTRGIPGSQMADIMKGLSSYSIPSTDITALEDRSQASNQAETSYYDKQSGYTFSYTLLGDDSKAIISGSFTLQAEADKPDTAYLAMSKAYFGYVSTFPYDTASQEAARIWTEAAVETVAASGQSESLSIGDTTFTVQADLDEAGVQMSLSLERTDPEA